MSSNADDPESSIPWPGFVDILSTVIIVFVFFMMMTSVIIFMLAKQERSKAVAEAREEAVVEAKAQEVPELSDLLIENQQLKRKVEELVRVKSILSESEKQVVVPGEGYTDIVFEDYGVTLLPETAAFLKASLPKNGIITIKASVPGASMLGATREIALNRALNVRNLLMQAGVPPHQIRLKIDATDSIENAIYGGVRLQTGK